MRLEMPSKIDAPVYHLETLEENGLLLFYESNEINDEGNRRWYFSLYNTQLEEEWLQFVALKDGMVFKDLQKKDKWVYMLFYLSEKNKDNLPGFQLLTFNTEDDSFSLFSGSLPDKAEIFGFEMGIKHALIMLNLKRYQTDALMLNLSDGSLKSIPLQTLDQCIPQALTYDQATGYFILALKQYESNRFDSDLFLVLDEAGNEMLRYVFNDPQERFLHSFVFHFDEEGSLVVIGSYNDRDRRDQRISEGSTDVQNEAVGLFFISLTGQGVNIHNHYDFKNFTDIYSSLSVQDLMRARQRQARSRRESTDVPIHVAFQFYGQQLINQQATLIYAAEAFRPQYRTETRMEYDFYGRPIPYTYTIFEGFNFFNYLMAGFDKQGKLIWNNDFEMRDMLSYNLKDNILAFPDSSTILLAYNNNGRITSKMISQDQTIGAVEQIRNDTFYPTDRIQEENFSGIKHWYDHYFITYGYQRIANNRLRENNLRSVFYINKLAFD